MATDGNPTEIHCLGPTIVAAGGVAVPQERDPLRRALVRGCGPG